MSQNQALLEINIQHFLRTFVIMSELLDEPVSLLIILEISAANTQHLDRERHACCSDDVVPDVQRRPASILAVADSLGLPHETVRRRAQKLEAQRLIVSVPGGVIVSAAFWGSREPLLEANLNAMRRLFAELDRLDAPNVLH